MKTKKKTKPSISDIWVTSDGKMMRVGDMKDSHVLNCIRLMERRAAAYAIDADEAPAELADRLFPIYRVMVNDLQRRLDESAKIDPPENTVGRPFRFD